jgi:uncharacterized protein YecE (DUF72 family)
MSVILVGTASWADKSLVDSKLFYPKEAKTAESRLRYYASHFSLVEVDSSYYASLHLRLLSYGLSAQGKRSFST